MAASPDPAQLGAALALASGVPLVVLGALLLAVRPRRAEQVFFGLFVAFWGAQVVLANLGRAVDSAEVHRGAFLASFALQPAAYLFLAHTAALHAGPRTGRALTAAFALVAFAATVALVLAPGAVLAEVAAAPDGGIGSATLGPAAVPLFAVPFFGAFYVTIAIAWRAYAQSPPGSPRARLRGVLLAFGLFTTYYTVRNLFRFLGSSLTLLDPASNLALLALLALGGLLLAGVVALLVLRPPAPAERDPWLLAAFVVPALWAAGEGALAWSGTEVDTVGLWRVLGAAGVAYTLARYQLFDLDLRLKRVAGPAVAALLLGFGALAALAFFAVQRGAVEVASPLLLGAVGAGVVYGVREPFGERLFPGVTDEPDYLYQRKLEVYRAGLERALAEPGQAGRGELRKLRKSLGLSEREAQVVEVMVRSTLGGRAAPDPAAPPRVEPGATILGRYRVERLIGEGAHGRAYLSYDEKLDRNVVVKAVGTSVLGGKAARLLLREARLAGSMKHPNVVEIHDVAEAPHECVIVMEFADGGSLFNLLQRKGRLDLVDATAALDQILAGLEAAHGKGVIHRDIKPENILLMKDGTVKVADFGVARDARPDATGISAGGGAIGTLLYMSPEQVRGLEVDARSDLYAAAVVFYQMLTGRFYLRIAGKDDFQVRQLILRSPPQFKLDGQPAWVRGFLLKALAKDAGRRFGSAREMRAALRREAGLKPAEAKASSPRGA